MPPCYQIVNFTRRERVGAHMPASKAMEFVDYPAAMSLVTWYFLVNRGDNIAFVSEWDMSSRKVFFGQQISEDFIYAMPDKTEEVIKGAVACGFIKSVGFRYRDDDEPERYYIRSFELGNPDELANRVRVEDYSPPS